MFHYHFWIIVCVLPEVQKNDPKAFEHKSQYFVLVMILNFTLFRKCVCLWYACEEYSLHDEDIYNIHEHQHQTLPPKTHKPHLYNQNQTSDQLYKNQKRGKQRDLPHNLSIIDELIEFKQKDNQCIYSLVPKSWINIQYKKILYIPYY